MKEPESISDSLMSSIVNDYSSSALMEMGESLLDGAAASLVDSDVLTKIPVLGTLIGFTKGVLTFRDRRYANKILGFLAETAKASKEDKQKYRKKLKEDPDEYTKAGEVILDIIDKITSTDKAVMIGKVFRVYMREDGITTAQLIYLCEIIERAYLQDLEKLRHGVMYNNANLESIGIKKPLNEDAVNELIQKAMKQADENREREFSSVRRGMSAPIPVYPAMNELGLTPEGFELIRILREN